MSDSTDVAEAILELITAKPQRSQEVQAQLMSKGFTSQEVRAAVATLWDEGRLNVGLDQRLQSTGIGR